MAEVDEVARRHAFHPLRVKQVVQETDDTRSFVLDVPPDLGKTYRYRPGQFCTFRVRIGGDEAVPLLLHVERPGHRLRPGRHRQAGTGGLGVQLVQRHLVGR